MTVPGRRQSSKHLTPGAFANQNELASPDATSLAGNSLLAERRESPLPPSLHRVLLHKSMHVRGSKPDRFVSNLECRLPPGKVPCLADISCDALTGCRRHSGEDAHFQIPAPHVYLQAHLKRTIRRSGYRCVFPPGSRRRRPIRYNLAEDGISVLMHATVQLTRSRTV